MSKIFRTSKNGAVNKRIPAYVLHALLHLANQSQLTGEVDNANDAKTECICSVSS